MGSMLPYIAYMDPMGLMMVNWLVFKATPLKIMEWKSVGIFWNSQYMDKLNSCSKPPTRLIVLNSGNQMATINHHCHHWPMARGAGLPGISTGAWRLKQGHGNDTKRGCFSPTEIWPGKMRALEIFFFLSLWINKYMQIAYTVVCYDILLKRPKDYDILCSCKWPFLG